jgi:hypothetical protein
VASVTRYYAQIAITLVAGLLLLVFGVWNPGRQIGFWGPLEWIPASFVGALLFAAGLGVMAWQYAERRSWAGRGVLVAAVGLCLATPRIQPPDAAVVLASSWWEPEDLQPIRLRFVARRLGLERGISRAETFSLQVEGVPAQMLAEPELLKVSIHGARGNSWDSGWRPRDSASFTTTWMSSGGEMPNSSIQVRIDEELADRTRPVGTRIEVAMTIYRLGTSVPIKSDGRRHEIPGIGSCWIGMGAFGQALSCDSAGYPAALARIYGAEDVGTSGRIFIQRAMPLRWYGALFDLNPVLSWSTGMQGDAAQMLTVEWPVARIRREITLDRPWQRAR